jgi:hypothetical protein
MQSLIMDAPHVLQPKWFNIYNFHIATAIILQYLLKLIEELDMLPTTIKYWLNTNRKFSYGIDFYQDT